MLHPVLGYRVNSYIELYQNYAYLRYVEMSLKGNSVACPLYFLMFCSVKPAQILNPLFLAYIGH